MKKIEIGSLVLSFGAKDMNSIEDRIDAMAPSNVEHLILEAAEFAEEGYLNLNQVEKTINTYSGDIYLTYGGECFLDPIIKTDFETESMF